MSNEQIEQSINKISLNTLKKYNKYINLKNEYKKLKLRIQSEESSLQLQSEESSLRQFGGAKNKSAKRMLTTFDFVSRSDLPTKISLQKVVFIKKICTFDVKNTVVIGDTDYNVLKLKKGKYDAYKVDDNLVIIHHDLKIKPTKKNITEWIWTNSYVGVGVDSGCFGFYDLDTIKEINELLDFNMKKKNKNHKNTYTNYNNLPSFEINFKEEAYPISGRNIEKLTEKQKTLFDTFGVLSSTGTGDGDFYCYTIKNDRAILIGGYTGEETFFNQ